MAMTDQERQDRADRTDTLAYGFPIVPVSPEQWPGKAKKLAECMSIQFKVRTDFDDRGIVKVMEEIDQQQQTEMFLFGVGFLSALD